MTHSTEARLNAWPAISTNGTASTGSAARAATLVASISPSPSTP